ncbi:glycerol ethanol, ferric requiring protein [Ascosphaera pollenicola]|nr:glycerol ethanol, ferric requiring protein [Ascosphaera pollenicola]
MPASAQNVDASSARRPPLTSSSRRSSGASTARTRAASWQSRPLSQQNDRRSEEEIQTSTPSSSQNEFMTEQFGKIKRYEDFSTIDWVQDAVYEDARRRIAKRHAGPTPVTNLPRGTNIDDDTTDPPSILTNCWSSWNAFWSRPGSFGWRHKVYESYDAGQRWVVITLVGAAIGLNSAVLNIVTEWLSDIKIGHCTTAWYLNESFCCWGEEEGQCPQWKHWSRFSFANYIIYAIWAVLMAFCAGALVNTFEPYAAGSGISEIKVIVAGFVMRGFLGARTLAVKSITLPLSIGSGLSVGKEGPSVHFAACTGNVISSWFEKYRRNRTKMREILTASSAAGVAVAFGSPIGGVLFALEEVASYFPLQTLWRSYYCALVAVFVLSLMNPFRTGQLVMFQVKYDRTWHLFELISFVLLGVFGGLYGAFTIKWNLRATAFRKKHFSSHPIMEATVLAGLTALVCYPNSFLRINMTEMMEILFAECEKDIGGHDGICESRNRWRIVLSLFFATVVRILLVIISYGCKVPAGIFVPSMAIGASFGRMIGIMAQSLHESFADSRIFSSCQPDMPCITPGTYAFLGAGAALSGIMHLTISVTVIMFELTGATTYILPTMIVVGVTKVVGDLLGAEGGIADRMITVNGLPFLDNKETYVFGAPVSHAMTRQLTVISATSMTLRDLQCLLNNRNPVTNEKTPQYQGWPVVLDKRSRLLVGWIGRMELSYAVDKALSDVAVEGTSHCRFISHREVLDRGVTYDSVDDDAIIATATPDASELVDFSAYVDRAPISVQPALPLETAVEMFKKLGPRVILVEHQGRLLGLLTVKDLLKYKFQTEAEESQGSDSPTSDSKEGLVEKSALRILRFLGKLLRKMRIWRAPDHSGYFHVGTESADSSRISLTADVGLDVIHEQDDSDGRAGHGETSSDGGGQELAAWPGSHGR